MLHLPGLSELIHKGLDFLRSRPELLLPAAGILLPGCPCCEPPGKGGCSLCTPDLPPAWQAVIAGSSANDCATCSLFNGTIFLLPCKQIQGNPNASPCCYTTCFLSIPCYNTSGAPTPASMTLSGTDTLWTLSYAEGSTVLARATLTADQFNCNGTNTFTNWILTLSASPTTTCLPTSVVLTPASTQTCNCANCPTIPSAYQVTLAANCGNPRNCDFSGTYEVPLTGMSSGTPPATVCTYSLQMMPASGDPCSAVARPVLQFTVTITNTASYPGEIQVTLAVQVQIAWTFEAGANCVANIAGSEAGVSCATATGAPSTLTANYTQGFYNGITPQRCCQAGDLSALSGTVSVTLTPVP